VGSVVEVVALPKISEFKLANGSVELKSNGSGL
jgi:hypothetical protein